MSEETSADFLQRLGIDGNSWAEEFVKRHGGDIDLMRAWFCSAIMAGYDHAEWNFGEDDDCDVVGFDNGEFYK